LLQGSEVFTNVISHNESNQTKEKSNYISILQKNVNVVNEDNWKKMNINDIYIYNLKENTAKIKIHHHPKKQFGCECDLGIVVQDMNTIHNYLKANCKK
jgi:aspartyl-tRNA synthetase